MCRASDMENFKGWKWLCGSVIEKRLRLQSLWDDALYSPGGWMRRSEGGKRGGRSSEEGRGRHSEQLKKGSGGGRTRGGPSMTCVSVLKWEWNSLSAHSAGWRRSAGGRLWSLGQKTEKRERIQCWRGERIPLVFVVSCISVHLLQYSCKGSVSQCLEQLL